MQFAYYASLFITFADHILYIHTVFNIIISARVHIHERDMYHFRSDAPLVRSAPIVWRRKALNICVINLRYIIML